MFDYAKQSYDTISNLVYIPAVTSILGNKYCIIWCPHDLSLSIMHYSKPWISTSLQLVRVLRLLRRQFGWNRQVHHTLNLLSLNCCLWTCCPAILEGCPHLMLKLKSLYVFTAKTSFTSHLIRGTSASVWLTQLKIVNSYFFSKWKSWSFIKSKNKIRRKATLTHADILWYIIYPKLYEYARLIYN